MKRFVGLIQLVNRVASQYLANDIPISVQETEDSQASKACSDDENINIVTDVTIGHFSYR